jgi:hypothetical protein
VTAKETAGKGCMPEKHHTVLRLMGSINSSLGSRGNNKKGHTDSNGDISENSYSQVVTYEINEGIYSTDDYPMKCI